MHRWLMMVLAFLAAGVVRGETIYVSGMVFGTWTADTVMVTGDVTVQTGSSLTIVPGVQVRFTGPYKLIVNGLLTARGTVTDSILFTRAFATEESKWRGLRFDQAVNASFLEYCRIEWAKNSAAYPEVHGGGVWMNNCSPTIRNCRILNNYSHNANYNGMGAGICPDNASNSVIEYNHILLNQADSGGGICVGSYSHPIIRNNLIENNQGIYAGGGIYVAANAAAEIYNNIIRNNSSAGWGGGGLNLWSATWLYGTFSNVYDNLFLGNTASDAGGAIYSRYDASQIINNTLVNNTANRGGGIYVLTFSNLPPTLMNSILWSNTAPTGAQIYLDPAAGSVANVSYCDVEGNWAGVGNIADDPEFISYTQQDFRLSWGSPCIDTGNPDPQYNDPDGTRSDMGGYYFDQNAPVAIFLTPHITPIQIPAGGGSFDYTIMAVNISGAAQAATIWCNVTLPNGSTYGPVLGPVTVSLGTGSLVNRVRTQIVPASAPAGLYSYNAYAAVGADTSHDSFTFSKAGAIDGELGVGGWMNTGEEFSLTTQIGFGESDLPGELSSSVSPNPFNPTTTIRFTLPQARWVTVEVFDVAGRIVTPLSGSGATPTMYPAGRHQITFDGSGLPSGMYVYRLQAGEQTASGKMVLMK